MNKKNKVYLGIFCLLFSTLTIIFSIESSNLSLIDPTQNDDALDNVKTSGFWNLNHIHIDDNWSDTAAAYDWCFKENGFYVIENVTINVTYSPTGSGILIQNSKNDYFIIRNCTIYNAGTASSTYDAGIQLLNTNNGTLVGNNCSYNGFAGIVLRQTSSNTCTNNSVYDNQLNHNTQYGLRIVGLSTTNNRIINNEANNNQYGIQSYSWCNNNLIKNNTLINNTLNGINLYYAQNEILSGNIMENCGIDLLDSLNAINSHTIYNNNTVNGKPVYYYVSEQGLNHENFSNAGQIILVGCQDSVIEDLSITHSSIGIALYYCHNITIQNTTLTDHIYRALIIYARAGISENNTIYNNTINNNNIGIFFTGTASGTCSYNRIENNSFADNNYGIYFDQNSKKNNITENTGLNSAQRFIYMDEECDNNTIQNNTITGGYRAIEIYSCANNTIFNNTISAFTYLGISLIDSEDNILINNTVIDSITAIYISADSSNNQIMYNTLRDNNWNGIRINGADNNYIFKNSIFNTDDGSPQDYGIRAYSGSTYNRIIGNTIFDNTISGILFWSCNNNSIIDNTVSNIESNDQSMGIEIHSSGYNNITGNTANDNSNYGIYLENCDNNRLVNNTCLEQSGIGDFQNDGIRLEDSCDWNVLIGNNASGNSNRGIILDSVCTNNHIEDNIVQHNSVGIELSTNCSDNTIVNNVHINNNTGTGIHLVNDCDDNDIQSNTLTYNQYGIVIENGCDSNTFWSNQIINNTNAGAAILSGSTVSQNNLFYNNIFSNPLGMNAFSNCSNNNWDNGVIGNDWHDYVGDDANDDGVGDTPYIINGTGNNQDNKPIFEDGQDVFPGGPGGIDPALIGGIVAAIVIPLVILGAIGYIYYKDPDKVKNAIKKFRS